MIDEDKLVVTIEERLGVEELASIIMNFYNYGTDNYDDMVNDLLVGVHILMHQRS